MRIKTMVLRLMLLLAAVMSCNAYAAEVRNVSSAAELVNALDELKDDAGNTIVLAPGVYDVSGYNMLCNDADKSKYLWSTSHIAISRLTLKGGGESAHETVIYGDRSQRVLYMWQGRLMNLTVSNGCTRAGENIGGGGVLGRNASSLLSNVVVVCCKAYSGGGVSSVSCTDCTITRNQASEHSGGAGSCTIVGGYVLDNESGKYGGGCSWSTCTGVEISRNRAGTYGGGVFCSTLKDCTISENVSLGGGGGVYFNAGGYSVEGCDIVSNSTTSVNGGGGIAFNSSSPRVFPVRDCLIAHNRSSSHGGGAVYAMLVGGCIVSNNVSDAAAEISSYGGGGLYRCAAYDSTITHNLITTDYPTNTIYGGGLYDSMASNCVVSGNAVANCDAKTKMGGGGRNTTFIDCRIFNNFCTVGAAMNEGSAIGCVISNNVSHNGKLIIRNVSFLTRCDIWNTSIDTPRAMMNSSVHGFGQGWTLEKGDNVHTNGYFAPVEGTSYLIVNTQGEAAATNCLFYGNICNVLVSRPDSCPPKLPLVNCTISDNRFDALFSGLKQEKTTMGEFVNCIICRNRTKDGSAVYDLSIVSSADTYVSFRNCMFDRYRTSSWAPYEESGTVLCADPRFDAESIYPYSLRRSSPAFGKGVVQGWMADSTDIRCEAAYSRLRDGAVEIGCYQCHLIPPGMVVSIR